MAKGGRKKREKRKDFQKVKLKVGKRKPQADNFTQTTFKSQAVQIRDQLKSAEGVDPSQPTTQRKKNIQELLCHLNHYNASIRQTAVSGMKELLSAHPALIAQRLPSLLDGLSVLITDKEGAVRKAGISLMQLVVRATPGDRIRPFFPVLSAHLSCAMTHLQEDVRLDSLAVLDLVLAHYPDLLTSRRHSRDLLAVFVQQIARQRPGGAGAGGGLSWAEGQGQSGTLELAVEPGSRIASHKWRQKVLLRLRQFLTALLQEQRRRKAPRDDPSPAMTGSDYTTVPVNAREVAHAAVYGPGAQATVCRNTEGFVLSALSSTSLSASGSDLATPEALLGFVRSLVPLLLQCWMEVAPKMPGHGQVQLHAVALETLAGVLSVIQLLWRWMRALCKESQDFRCMTQLQKAYQRRFLGHLLPCFPYTSHNAPARARQSGKATAAAAAAPASVVSLNLALCEIMSHFLGRGGAAATVKEAWLAQVMAYVLQTCVEGADLPADDIKSLLGVVRRLVQALASQESIGDLLQAVHSLYDGCHDLSSGKAEAMRCLEELLSVHRDINPSSRSVDSLFLQSLPDLVLAHGSQRALDILLRRAAQHQPEALKCIQRSLGAIVDPEGGILLKLTDALQVAVVHLVHYAHPLDLATLRSLALCCHDNRLGAANVARLVGILSARFLDVGVSTEMDPKLPFNVSDFISFLFSVSIGSSGTDLSRLPGSSQDLPPPHSLTDISVVANGPMHRPLQDCTAIVKSVCISYGLISSKQQMWDIVCAMITECLSCHQVLPYGAVYALLYTTNHLNPDGDADWSAETTDKLTGCCLATLYRLASDNVAGVLGGDWARALWGLTTGLLVRCGRVLAGLMERIQSCVPDVTDADHIQRIATVMIRLLQAPQLSLTLAQSLARLQPTIQQILSHQLATEDCRWVAELRYEASLVLQAQPQ